MPGEVAFGGGSRICCGPGPVTSPKHTPGEEFVSAYVESALARRYVSNATGEPLTGPEVARWCALLSRIPEDVRPAWGEDPAKHVLEEFYRSHGHLEVAGPLKDRSTGDTQLVKTLRELRQARCRDV